MRLLLGILLILSHFFVFAKLSEIQTYVFQHLSVEDGLSQSTIYDIVQDNEGYLWFATYNGLNRYDGINFKVFQKANDSTELECHLVSKLLLDSKNNLWVASSNGLGRYSPDQDKIIRIQSISNFSEKIHRVEDLIEDKNGNIWICSSMGFFKYSYKTNSVEKLHFISKDQTDTTYLYIKNIVNVNNNTFYLSSDATLYSYSIHNQQLDTLATLTTPSDKNQIERIKKLYIDNRKNVWVSGYQANFYKYSIEDSSFTQISIPKTPVFNDIVQENDSTLLLGTAYTGLLRFHTETEECTRIYDKHSPIKRIKQNKIRRVYIDNNRVLWLGHFQGGLSFTNLASSNFKYYNNLGNSEYIYKITSASSILKDSKNRLWVGTDGKGLFRSDSPNAEPIRYRHEDFGKNHIASSTVLSLFEDSNNNIWAGTYNKGLLKFNENTQAFETYKLTINNTNGINTADVRSITEDKEGNIWVILHGIGFGKLNPTTREFVQYVSIPNTPMQFTTNWTFDITVDNNNLVWITTSNGLFSYNDKTKEIDNHFAQNNNSTLSDNNVFCTHYDSKGQLWFGTNKGLNKYDYETRSFINTELKTGIEHESIISIEEAGNGDLWLGTGNGLYAYTPSTKRIRHYIESDGLQGNEFLMRSSYRDSEGNMYFGGVNGISVFDPSEIKTNTTPPKIKLIGVNLMGSPLSPKELNQTEHTFTHEENFFTFYFIALNFLNPEKNNYKYRLEGLEDEWQEAGLERKAVYTSLPPGDYTFNVIASNNDGVWNEKGISFSFTIKKPWWKSLWFYFISIFALSFIAFLIYVFRIRSVSIQNKILELKVKERTMELSHANEFLEKNTRKIEDQHKRLKNQKKEIETVNKALKKTNHQLAEREFLLKDKNNQLTALINTKDKMLSIIAHDLKNPMNTVIGFSSLVLKKGNTYSEDKRANFLKLINQSSVQAYNLLENLLTWARSQTGNIQLNITRYNINDLINESLHLLKQTAEKKSLQIDFTPDDDSIIGEIDTNTISTVLRNLFSNAIKFTPNGGSIQISAKITPEALVEIKVIDNGVGMTEFQQEKLFRVEANNTTNGTNEEKGTGLGLVICKEFMEMNSGSISVESESGKGSTFTILFPLIHISR